MRAGKLVGITDEVDGGIIAYAIGGEHADRIVIALNGGKIGKDGKVHKKSRKTPRGMRRINHNKVIYAVKKGLDAQFSVYSWDQRRATGGRSNRL
jgi:hypothetical protein